MSTRTIRLLESGAGRASLQAAYRRASRSLKAASGALAIALVATFAPAGAQASEVVVYGFPGGYIEAAAKAFKKLHPDVDVSVITGDGPEILGRLIGERERPRADVVDLSGEIILTHSDLFQPWRSSHHNDFPDWALMKKGDDLYGYGYSVSLQVFMVNTRRMPLDQAPKSWKALAEPSMKGKFIFGNPALVQAGLASFKQMQIMYGDDMAAKLVENARFGDSASVIPPAVGRGEVPVGVVEESRVATFKKDGYPVEIIYPEEGIVPTLSVTALVKNGPNPKNAQLFADFLASAEGHAINLAVRGRRSPRTGAPTPPTLPPLEQLKINAAVSPEKMLENRQETLDLFNKFFMAKGG